MKGGGQQHTGLQRGEPPQRQLSRLLQEGPLHQQWDWSGDGQLQLHLHSSGLSWSVNITFTKGTTLNQTAQEGWTAVNPASCWPTGEHHHHWNLCGTATQEDRNALQSHKNWKIIKADLPTTHLQGLSTLPTFSLNTNIQNKRNEEQTASSHIRADFITASSLKLSDWCKPELCRAIKMNTRTISIFKHIQIPKCNTCLLLYLQTMFSKCNILCC